MKKTPLIPSFIHFGLLFLIAITSVGLITFLYEQPKSASALAMLTATPTATQMPSVTPTTGALNFNVTQVPTPTPKPKYLSSPPFRIQHETLPKTTQNNGPIPDIAQTFCIPKDQPITEALVLDIVNTNVLLVEIDSEIFTVELLGVNPVDADQESVAYINAILSMHSLLNQTVTLSQTDEVDISNHVFRYVIFNEHFINYELLEAGLAKLDLFQEHPCKGFFMVAERNAWAEKQGIWAQPPFPSNNWTTIAPFFDSPIQFWSKEIEDWAVEYDVDVNLIATVMLIESCGDPEAESPAGATSLFQVMPFHFPKGEDPFDPYTNAKRGIGYLHDMLLQFGNVDQALAAYNAGPHRAIDPPEDWPYETRNYVYWGTHIYQDALDGKLTSEIFDEWKSVGGGEACEWAAKRLGLPYETATPSPTP